MEQERKLVVYSMGVRVSLIGELVSDTETTLTMRKVLKLETEVNPQTGEIGSNSIGPMTHASRESNVIINKTIMAGIVVDNPDPDIVKVYDREILPCYSKLKLT